MTWVSDRSGMASSGAARRDMNPHKRSRLLWKLADALQANADELGTLETADNGKPFFESRKVDLPSVIENFRYFAGLADKIEGATIPVAGPFLNYTLLDQTLAEEAIPYAIENDVGILIGSPIADGLLSGHEPIQTREGIHDEDGKVIPAAVGSFLDPNAYPSAHAMWRRCTDRGINIRHLAMQFAMNAPVSDKGIVLTGAANLEQLEDSLHIATTPVDEEIWQQFEAEFGVQM